MFKHTALLFVLLLGFQASKSFGKPVFEWTLDVTQPDLTHKKYDISAGKDNYFIPIKDEGRLIFTCEVGNPKDIKFRFISCTKNGISFSLSASFLPGAGFALAYGSFAGAAFTITGLRP